MDRKRNILEAKSKQSVKETFGLVLDGEKYAGILAIATLSLVNEVKILLAPLLPYLQPKYFAS
jgi:hypothetical protein